MQSNQVIPSDKSYWIAAIVTVFVIGLLMLTLSLTAKIEENSLDFSAEFYVDEVQSESQDSLVLEDLLRLEDSQWQSLDKQNLGLSDFVHWIKISPESLALNEQYFLEINYGLLDNVDAWVFKATDAQGVREMQQFATFSSGDARPFALRPIQHEQFLFPIRADSQTISIILRVESKGPIKLPLRLWKKAAFIEYSGSHKLFMGLFFGYMIAMALSNLFIYATTRKSTFAVYTAYVTSIAMVAATLHGIGFRYFWSNNVWFQERAIAFFACLTLIFIIIFSMQVLDLKNTSPRAYKLLRSIKVVFFLLFALSFVLPYDILLTSILVMIASTTPVILISSIRLAINGNLIARYFSGAWAALLISGITLTFENLGIQQVPIDPSYLLMVGAIAETLLLALALAISFSTQYKEAEAARAAAIENERQAVAAKDELLKLQEKAKQELEYSVEERTLELEIAMRELSEANFELERLSAIDPLTELMNRRYFNKRLLAESRRSRREQRPMSLAMLDIDYFKKVNDTYGHLAGDECLKVFARVLREQVKRPSDIICRYGGEEFVAILPATELEGASKLMEKVRQVTEETPIKFEGQTLYISVSIGVTSHIITQDEEQELVLAFADRLLYEAKQAGRNQVKAQAYA